MGFLLEGNGVKVQVFLASKMNLMNGKQNLDYEDEKQENSHQETQVDLEEQKAKTTERKKMEYMNEFGKEKLFHEM